jgi:Uma2 family endonuclease
VARTSPPWTAAELGRLPEGWRYEIDEGELIIMAPAGFEHGDLTLAAAVVLRAFVHEHKLGRVIAGEPGFYLQRNPDVLRAPDVAYISNERLAKIADRRGFPEVPPDLAVEIHLPDEADMEDKVRQYLTAGVRSVWVIDPHRRTLTQFWPDAQQPRVLSDPSAIVDDPVLPGFACHLSDLLAVE